MHSKVGIRTRVGLRVPFLEVAVVDAELDFNSVTLVTRGDLVELITLGYNTGHGRGGPSWGGSGSGASHLGGAGGCGCGAGRLGGAGRRGSSGRGYGADHTVVLAVVKSRTLCVRVQFLKLIDRETPTSTERLAGVTDTGSHREATANIPAHRHRRRGKELWEETNGNEVVKLHLGNRLFEVDVEEENGTDLRLGVKTICFYN